MKRRQKVGYELTCARCGDSFFDSHDEAWAIREMAAHKAAHDKHDADHAAAIEREKVAAWLEAKVINECREPFHSGNDGEILTVRIFIPRDQVACAHSLLAAIRNGAHNEAP